MSRKVANSILDILDRRAAARKPLLAKSQAAKELRSKIPPAKQYVGLIGIDLSFESIELFPTDVTIRRITNPPELVHVICACDDDRSDWMGIARYSPHISAELTVGGAVSCDSTTDELMEDAWHSAALVKLRGAGRLICPIAASVSWDTVAAYDDKSVQFKMLDDVPRAILLNEDRRHFTASDARWVLDNYMRALGLRDGSNSKRFGLAFDVSYRCNHASDPRIVMANVWYGLDALFGKNERNSSAKLCGRIADFVPNTTYSEVRKLYDLRCDAIHGRPLKLSSINDAMRRSYAILQDCLIRSIESGEKTLPDWQ